MLQVSFRKGGFWFRIFGWGLTVIDRSKWTPFSVRNGYSTECRIGKYGIKILKPYKL